MSRKLKKIENRKIKPLESKKYVEVHVENIHVDRAYYIKNKEELLIKNYIHPSSILVSLEKRTSLYEISFKLSKIPE